MYRLTAILLIIGVLFQSMDKLVVIANYEVHKDFIAKNLCENRDKPQMKCCGKCYLKKQLSKTEGNSKQAPVKSEKSDVVAVLKQKITLPEYPHFYSRSYNISNESLYTFNYLSAPLHPPAC